MSKKNADSWMGRIERNGFLAFFGVLVVCILLSPVTGYWLLVGWAGVVVVGIAVMAFKK